MDVLTNRHKRENGMSFSELTIVLGVTLVLTAILMPAIAGSNPERAETLLSAASIPVVIEGNGILGSSIERTESATRHEDRMARSRARAESSSTVDSRRLKGMRAMKTTDVRHMAP